VDIPKRLRKPPTNRQAFLTVSPRAKAERQALQHARVDPVVRMLYGSTVWRELRATVLRDAGYICATPGCVRRAAVVDHRIPHHGDNDLFFSRDNLQPFCKRCHDQKTARHDGGFGNRRRNQARRLTTNPFAAVQGPHQGGGK
jgi:5-methylcytosine-specific restriction protein A